MKIKKGLISLLFLTITFSLVSCENSKTNIRNDNSDEYVLEFSNGERFFKSEATPKTDAEIAVLESLKIQINDEYDKFKDIYIDCDHYPEVYKSDFKEGKYTQEIIVHSLNELDEKEFCDKNDQDKYYPYMGRLREYNPSEFKVIEVKYTDKYTDKLNEIAQFPSGSKKRYFVVVKKKDSDWRIFDIYGYM